MDKLFFNMVMNNLIEDINDTKIEMNLKVLSTKVKI